MVFEACYHLNMKPQGWQILFCENTKKERAFPRGNALSAVDVVRSVEDPAQAEDAQSREQHVDGNVGHGQQEQVLEYILGTFRYFYGVSCLFCTFL